MCCRPFALNQSLRTALGQREGCEQLSAMCALETSSPGLPDPFTEAFWQLSDGSCSFEWGVPHTIISLLTSVAILSSPDAKKVNWHMEMGILVNCVSRDLMLTALCLKSNFSLIKKNRITSLTFGKLITGNFIKLEANKLDLLLERVFFFLMQIQKDL